MDTDVLVIGGGIAGLLCAYWLQQAGLDYALVEAGRIAHGVTGNTTAKITSQHGLIYDRLIREHGAERAALYLRSQEEALDSYRQLAANIDCDFSELPHFVYARHDATPLQQELAALRQLGYPARFVDELPLPFPLAGALGFPRQAQFHPLKFLAALTPGLRIYEQTRVIELQGLTARTGQGRIRARRIIVATHFPFIDKHGCYFLKMYQQRSYVLALANAADVQGMYLDAESGGLSFRNHGQLLLLGGGSRRTGKHSCGWQQLEAFARRYYPGSELRYRWANQDCLTVDSLPYIGPYSARTRGLYVATGFNKWGMTGAMTAARLLVDMITEQPNDYAALFSPSRSFLRPQLALNAGEAALNLLKPIRPRCPHLGCALRWNAEEQSWDCPCHGSRFDEQGRLLNDPATGPLTMN